MNRKLWVRVVAKAKANVTSAHGKPSQELYEYRYDQMCGPERKRVVVSEADGV